MKCPRCGNELRRSKKDPNYGLCDNCRKKYTWREENKSVPARRPSQKQKKIDGKLKLLLLVLGIMIILGVFISLFGKDKSKDTPNEKNSKTEFTVGDTAKQEDVHITLRNTTESSGGEFVKPEDGKIFLLCEFEIVNNSDKEIAISSIANFDAYCDDTSLNQDLFALQVPEAEGKGQLDGSVAAGKKMNGVIAYQVPAEWKKFEISVTPNFWSKKDVKFLITK